MRPIFHSGRGSEYVSAPFCATVGRLGMQQSANASGPGHNAHTETFFHSRKAELIRDVTVLTERLLRTELTRLHALLQQDSRTLLSRVPVASCL